MSMKSEDDVEPKNWDAVPWTPFREAQFPELPEHLKKYKDTSNSVVYRNSIYQVELCVRQAPKPFGPAIHLSFKTLDKQARHDWREIQRIKNELVGEDVEAMELYPSEYRLVDTANQYHLWCFPTLDFPARQFPFGFPDRLVAEGSDPEMGANQRDFRPELRPEDAVHGKEITEAVKNAIAIKGYCPVDKTPLAIVGEMQLVDSDAGKQVTFVRAECMFHEKHVVLFAKKTDVDERPTQPASD